MCIRSVLFMTVIIAFFGRVVAAQELSTAYCQAQDYKDVCAEGEDPATCNPKIEKRTTDCAAHLDTPSVKWEIAWEDIKVRTSEYIEEILGALALFFAAIAAYFKAALSRLRSRIFDPLIKRAADISTSGLNVLVVGKGGAGKTSVIKALAGSNEINPNVANSINEFYSISHEIDTDKQGIVSRRILRLYFSDHVGQDFSSIPETAYFKEKKLANLPKALIFVVDLFDAAERFGVDALFEVPDSDRINDHARVYSPEMLDMITAGLQNEASIFLFINKSDKLNLPYSQIEKMCLDAFETLINRLRAIPGTQLTVVVGSAETGQSIMGAKTGVSKLGTSLLYEGVVNASALIEV